VEGRKPSRWLYPYYALCIAAAVCALAWLRPPFTLGSLGEIGFLVVLTLITEAMPVYLPRRDTTVSVSFILIYASILLFGPGAGGVVAGLGTIRRLDLTGRIPLRAFLFNRAQLALSAVAAGLAYQWFGGEVGTVSMPGDIPALLLSGAVYCAVNVTALDAYLSLLRHSSLKETWFSDFKWAMATYLVFLPISVLIALIYPVSQWVGRVYLGTIKALATALDAKDPYTFGHSERVARYAVAIGRRLGLPSNELELLEYVGVLHDIGKIGIRDAVLNKPGIFTSDEYEEMKKHPVIGSEIIGGIQLLGKGASWVRYHHERYDGGGFPEGLSGEDIPLGARIIAVADALDAMTSERPYKKTRTLDESIEELKSCSGTQFDPRVVDALLAVIRGTDTLGDIPRSSPAAGE